MLVLTVFLLYAIILTLALARAGLRNGLLDQTDGANTGAGETPRRLLLVGATGGTGRQLLEQALQRGFEVTAFVRNPVNLEISHERLRVAQGDVLDPASLQAAMQGQDAVLCALGHKRWFYPTSILSQGTANILHAMERAGVHRLVCETSLGIGDSAGRMGLYYTFFVIPLILPFYYWDKTRQERLIAQSAVDWTIVRPAALSNAKSRGIRNQGKSAGRFIWTVRIPRADVAKFMLDQLQTKTCSRTAVGIE